MENPNQNKFCVRVIFEVPGDSAPTRLLGKLLFEDEGELSLITGRGRTIRINKKYVILREETKIIFELQEAKQ